MDVVFEFVTRMLINLFDLYIIYRFTTTFFDSYKNKQLTITMYAIRYMALIIVNTFYSTVFLNMLTSILTIGLIVFSYSGFFSKKLAATFVIYIGFLLPDFLFAFLFQISDLSLWQTLPYDTVFMEIIMMTITWIETFIVRHFKNIKRDTPIPKMLLLAILTVPIILIIMEALLHSSQKNTNTIYRLTLLCFFCSLFSMIYLIDFLSAIFQERAKAELIKKEKSYYHSQSELLQKNHEDLRQFRHDIQNRMIVIQQLLKENNYSEVLAYTNKISERFEESSNYCTSGNIAIDSIINYKLSQAAARGIHVSCQIAIPDSLTIEDDDMVIILGNLIDNAAEATSRLKENRFIDIIIRYDCGTVLILVRNSYDSVLRIINGKIRTTKSDDAMHGIGLRSIEHVADKYNGILDLDYDDAIFEASVMLYAPDFDAAVRIPPEGFV